MFVNEIIYSNKGWQKVSTEKLFWNSAVNVREMVPRDRSFAEWLRKLSPAFILWINVLFESSSEVKSLSGHEDCEKVEDFHQSTVTELPGLPRL